MSDTRIDSLPALIAFSRVVSAGSLSAAAREMDLPLSVVSKRLAQLEKSVGVRLIQRTTRRQTLTEEGALFHARVVRILDEIEQAEELLSQRRQEVSGLLRVTAPGQLGRQKIAPLIADFQRLHPQLTVQLELTDAVVDLVESGFDLAIRFGSLADSSLIARTLAPNFRVLCASPAYLQAHGTPKHPDELTSHRCILIGDQRRAEWRFEGDESIAVRVDAAIVTNDGEAAHLFALADAGIAVKSIWDVGDDILAGKLRRVLPHHSMSAAPLHAIYPHSQHLAPRVRAFVDYLRERLAQAWRWETL
ncbi:LysR family transcriptional regulator [Paraburkholderia hospita]|jgi:DNA-binding transcriptional LysR family regulator|uniref:LysR family transcriptional regulator n=1 Tax=Paraburkholderia TaxID=1822464 RepID=UPI0002719D4E|nr:LysR family transcriptional regulator [Paraburkholderia hospita]EUC18896.1 transcriptional regulator, LysR family [Burkholderia sp. BT03]SKC66622.1 transcriptional regulator, LysR family [Paraburkholderia hospita]